MSNLGKGVFCAAILLFFIWNGQKALAQGAVSISVTPTLFDVSVDPGQQWRSSVRIINPNEQALTVFVEPVIFSAAGERGVSNFTRLESGQGEGATLAEWFELAETMLTIAPQETGQLHFTVDIPDDAAPGGQYAALLISTQPPPEEAPGSQVRTTQAVSSLFFMRVSGEISEQGRIRSFRAIRSTVNRPQNEFELRFENQGSVHLQPQGDITIYNMWGQRRGEIPVNQRTQFGKVLPETIRGYNFGWEGSFSLFDIGRYRAEVTLAYGDEQRAFANAEAAFWVIPWTGLLIVLGSIFSLVVIATWLIRRYIRRVLLLSGVGDIPKRGIAPAAGDIQLSSHTPASQPKIIDVHPSKDWFAPLRALSKDWQEVAGDADSIVMILSALWQLIQRYKGLLAALTLLILLLLIGIIFGRVVLDQERVFEVTIFNGESDRVVNSEEIALERLAIESSDQRILLDADILATLADADLTFTITNLSGIPGRAAQIAYELSEHVPIDRLQVEVDINRTARRSVVLYEPEQIDAAQVLSQVLGGALLSAFPTDDEPNTDITILIGTDQVPR